MRSKEHAHDYRYFPEPDLVPLRISEASLAAIRSTMPELPESRRARFTAEHGLSEYDAGVLTASAPSPNTMRKSPPYPATQKRRPTGWPATSWDCSTPPARRSPSRR